MNAVMLDSWPVPAVERIQDAQVRASTRASDLVEARRGLARAAIARPITCRGRGLQLVRPARLCKAAERDVAGRGADAVQGECADRDGQGCDRREEEVGDRRSAYGPRTKAGLRGSPTARRSSQGPKAAPTAIAATRTRDPPLPPSRCCARTLIAPADRAARSCTTASALSSGILLSAVSAGRSCGRDCRR